MPTLLAHCLRPALLGLLSALALVLLVSPAALADDVTVSIAPGPNDKDTGRGETLAWVVDPGTSITDSVVVTNRNDTPLQLGIDAKDAVTTSGGHLDLAPPESEDTGIGAWVGLEADSVSIPAGQTRRVPFTLTVPKDAAPGDYSGGIAVVHSAEGTTVSVRNRVATRLDVRVTGKVEVSHQVSDLSVSMPSTWHLLAPTTATVQYTLTNTGNARIYVAEKVTATGPLGIGALRTETTLQEVLPGASIHRSVQVDARPAAEPTDRGHHVLRGRRVPGDDPDAAGADLRGSVVAAHHRRGRPGRSDRPRRQDRRPRFSGGRTVVVTGPLTKPPAAAPARP